MVATLMFDYRTLSPEPGRRDSQVGLTLWPARRNVPSVRP